MSEKQVCYSIRGSGHIHIYSPRWWPGEWERRWQRVTWKRLGDCSWSGFTRFVPQRQFVGEEVMEVARRTESPGHCQDPQWVREKAPCWTPVLERLTCLCAHSADAGKPHLYSVLCSGSEKQRNKKPTKDYCKVGKETQDIVKSHCPVLRDRGDVTLGCDFVVCKGRGPPSVGAAGAVIVEMWVVWPSDSTKRYPHSQGVGSLDAGGLDRAASGEETSSCCWDLSSDCDSHRCSLTLCGRGEEDLKSLSSMEVSGEP